MKNRLIKLICLVMAAVSSVFYFGNSIPVIALDDIPEVVVDEDIDEKYFQFVGRLYAIVTREMHADEVEKTELARSLSGGISAAYDVM